MFGLPGATFGWFFGILFFWLLYTVVFWWYTGKTWKDEERGARWL